MKKIMPFVDKIELYLCYALYAVMLIACTLGVIARYVFNSSLPWTEELCRWCLMWVSFLGASYCVITGDHLKVDLLQTVILKNHPIVFRICETISAIIWIAASLVLVRYGWILVGKTMSVSSVLHVPMKIAYLCMPVGCAAMALRVIQRTIKSWLPKEADASDESAET